MSAAMLHFVCDRCGNRWAAYRSKYCPACKHTALWEFLRVEPARDLAASILNPAVSVRPIPRRVQS